MTREEAKELLPIIKAYAEGKTIQVLDNVDDTWNDLNEPVFDGDTSIYRIKPEPKYRPFNTAEECWQEMLKHQPFGWLKSKKSKCATLIGKVYMNKKIGIVWTTNEIDVYSASDLFDIYTFADGTPFGIKED